MRQYHSPEIVPDLLPYWENIDVVQEAHARTAARTLDDIMSSVGDLEHLDGATSYSILKPSNVDDFDEKTAIIVPLPAGHTVSPAMTIRSQLLLDASGIDSRLVIFPNNSYKQPPAYTLREHELKKVRGGNFGPIADRQKRVIEHLGINVAHVVGYSQGATIGAALMSSAVKNGSEFAVGNSGLFEPPNVERRTRDKLKKAFMGGGPIDGLRLIGSLISAINQSAVPALSEAQHTESITQVVRYLPGELNKINKGEKIPENDAIVDGFTRPRLSGDIVQFLAAYPRVSVLLGRAANSHIFTQQALDTTYETVIGDTIFDSFSRDNGDESEVGLRRMVVNGRGHELADQIVELSILGHLAINPDKLR